jgi:hypothetical protein
MSCTNVAISPGTWAALVCLSVAVGCIHDREVLRPAVAPVAPPAAVADVVAPSPEVIAAVPAVERQLVAMLEGGELIVGGWLALEAWLPDGGGRRVISAGAALHPRRFGKDHVLVWRAGADAGLRDGAVLELVSLQDGGRRQLVELPGFRCAGAADTSHVRPARLDVMAPAGFEVDSEKRVACLELADGAANSATVRVRGRIDLAQPSVSRWLAFGEAECAAPDGVSVGDPASDGVCWRIAEVASKQPDPTVFPFTFENEHVRMSAAKSGSRKLQVRGYEIESISPSNRWLVLAGDYTERETTYRRLLFLDRSRGTLFPMSDRAGPWAPPLSAPGAKLAVPVKQAQLISSATDVRWLGTGEDTEVLVLDNLVIRPGRAAFQIADAELAR